MPLENSGGMELGATGRTIWQLSKRGAQIQYQREFQGLANCDSRRKKHYKLGIVSIRTSDETTYCDRANCVIKTTVKC